MFFERQKSVSLLTRINLEMINIKTAFQTN